jgi:16S rRNA (guanine966-N2)-methyltransferase
MLPSFQIISFSDKVTIIYIKLVMAKKGKISRSTRLVKVYCRQMRIIAGTKRGMKLLGPKTQVSRPITDRVKESLFSVLYKYDLPAGKTIADLFSGVGSLGLEALSRGAEFVTFVEQDPRIIATLKKNIEKSGFDNESKVIRANAFSIGAPVNEQGYDLVFVDPPYARTSAVDKGSHLGRLMDVLQQQVSPDAIVVVRTSESTELLDRYNEFHIMDRRKWGTMAVTILQREANDE